MTWVADGLKVLSLASGGAFAGGALYINTVEHPSRRNLPVQALRQQWKQSFQRGAIAMPLCGTLSSVSALALYFLDEATEESLKPLWLVPMGAFLAGGVWTVAMMLPDINVLLDDGVIDKKGESWVRRAIDGWNLKHGMRTIIDIGTFSLITYLVMSGRK